MRRGIRRRIGTAALGGMLFASSSCLPDNYWAGSFTSVLNTALNTLTEIYLYNQFIDTTDQSADE